MCDTNLCSVASAEAWDETTPIPLCEDLAATIQNTAVTHIVNRAERAMSYARTKRPDILNIVSGRAGGKELLLYDLS